MAVLPGRVSLRLPTHARLLAAVADLSVIDAPAPDCVAVLDLETTGLGVLGGTAIPAVVGLTVAEAEQVQVHQWVLQRGGAEGRMLEEVAHALRLLAGRGAVVLSFNGASFDKPMLSARMSRWAIAPTWPRHVDLLPVARRIWGPDTPDCRLSTLEVHQLGARRVGDLSGARVAEVLAEALACPDAPGVAGEVGRVVDHNRIDLVSPLNLAVGLHDAVLAPVGVEQARGVARHLVVLGRVEDARRRLESTLSELEDLREPGRVELALDCATLRRRAGDPAGAAAIWAWVCADAPGHPAAHEGLAKHLEHGRRDPAAALAVARASSAPCPLRVARLARKAADRAIPAWQLVVGRWGSPATSAPV
jgi:uncharacterized protein YprB with RNaseH-like and TPR domain